MMQILLLVPKFRGEDQKKRSWAQNLRLSVGVHSCFSSSNEILVTLGGAQAVFFGGRDPEMHSSGTGPVTFFRGTILTWGAWPRNAPRGAEIAPATA